MPAPGNIALARIKLAWVPRRVGALEDLAHAEAYVVGCEPRVAAIHGVGRQHARRIDPLEARVQEDLIIGGAVFLSAPTEVACPFPYLSRLLAVIEVGATDGERAEASREPG